MKKCTAVLFIVVFLMLAFTQISFGANEEPPYCRFDVEGKALTVKSEKSFTIFVLYDKGEHEDAELQYAVEGFFATVKEEENSELNKCSVSLFAESEKGTGLLTVGLVDPDGIILDKDTIEIEIIPSDSLEPFIKFRTENEILELAWPALDQGFDLDYCGGGYDDAYIEYSTTGDIKINRNSNCTGEYLPYTDHTRIAIKSTIGIGGTITADLYSPDGELLATDTANVKVSPEWIVQLPLYLANAFATTGLAGIYLIGLPLLGVLLMPITIPLGYIGFLF